MGFMEIFSEIKAMIGKKLGVDAEKVTREAHLQFDLGADSLAILDLSAEISTRYGIELTVEEMVELNNIGELISLVESKTKT